MRNLMLRLHLRMIWIDSKRRQKRVCRRIGSVNVNDVFRVLRSAGMRSCIIRMPEHDHGLRLYIFSHFYGLTHFGIIECKSR